MLNNGENGAFETTTATRRWKHSQAVVYSTLFAAWSLPLDSYLQAKRGPVSSHAKVADFPSNGSAESSQDEARAESFNGAGSDWRTNEWMGACYTQSLAICDNSLRWHARRMREV